MTGSADRFWTGDVEVVFETARGYEYWVGELVRCFGDFGISDFSETWHRVHGGAPLIELTFRHARESHHVWLERQGDFIDRRLLDVFNAILGGPWSFTWSDTGEGVEVRRVTR